MIYEAFTPSVVFNKCYEERRKLLAARRKGESNDFLFVINAKFKGELNLREAENGGGRVGEAPGTANSSQRRMFRKAEIVFPLQPQSRSVSEWQPC